MMSPYIVLLLIQLSTYTIEFSTINKKLIYLIRSEKKWENNVLLRIRVSWSDSDPKFQKGRNGLNSPIDIFFIKIIKNILYVFTLFLEGKRLTFFRSDPDTGGFSRYGFGSGFLWRSDPGFFLSFFPFGWSRSWLKIQGTLKMRIPTQYAVCVFEHSISRKSCPYLYRK